MSQYCWEKYVFFFMGTHVNVGLCNKYLFSEEKNHLELLWAVPLHVPRGEHATRRANEPDSMDVLSLRRANEPDSKDVLSKAGKRTEF